MFYPVWSLSMIHMLISWLKYVAMLAVVQIMTLRFEGGNDFEIYTHPRTIGHSHRLGDKRSTVVYGSLRHSHGIHKAFTWHSLHNSFLAKTSGKCFPRVFHVFSTCCYVQRFTPRHWWPKSTHNPQKVQSSESWELFGSCAFWSRKTKKLRKSTLKRLWRYLHFCNVPLCASHNVNMFVDVVQFSPEIHPDGTQTFAISMQCLAAHCCTLLHLPASCWGWRSFLVSQHQNLWRHQAPLSEMIWNVRAVLRCLRCSFLSARWYVMTCYDFKMVRPCNKSVLQFTCNNLERVQSVSVFHSCKRYFQSYLSNVWATWMQGVLARCSLSGQNCGRILHMLRKMGQGWARMRYADLWWLY